MKIIKRITLTLILLFIIGTVFYLFYLFPRWAAPILTYHDFGYSGIQVAPDNFEKQMRFLKEKRYNVISLDKLVESIKQGKRFARNTIVITFDDGYQDNYTCAYPILTKYGFPATIFLISDYIGNKKDFLNWSEVRQMSKNNISFGAHTRRHVYLPSIKQKDTLWDEISGCKEIIEKNLGMSVYYFAYPNGGFNEEIEALVKKVGYKGACVTNRGFDVLNKVNMYELNRVSVRDANPYFSLFNILKPIKFRAKLSGYYNVFRKKRGREIKPPRFPGN